MKINGLGDEVEAWLKAWCLVQEAKAANKFTPEFTEGLADLFDTVPEEAQDDMWIWLDS